MEIGLRHSLKDAPTWRNTKQHNKSLDSPYASLSKFRNLGNFCIWNPESPKFLLEESVILGFGIRNPGNDWIPESKARFFT